MALADEIHDEAVHHRIALSRYSTGLVRRVLAQLSRVEADVVARLEQGGRSDLSLARLDELLAELRAIQAAGWKVINERVTTGVEGLAAAEAAFAGQIVSHGAEALSVSVTSARPAMSQVIAAVKARPFQGRLLREWLADTEESAARKVRDVIRQGYIEGRTIDQMARDLRGTRANGFRDGLLEVNRRGAEAIVRTAVTHTSNVASQEIYKAAGDFVVGWEFVATLDSRTSLTCASLDGKVYAIGKGPMPPRHINCRSVSIPRLRGMGPTPRTGYAAWLKKQSTAVQDDILGAAKGRLFRSGGLTVDRFTDRAGRVLTLDELRRRDASAFANAGL